MRPPTSPMLFMAVVLTSAILFLFAYRWVPVTEYQLFWQPPPIQPPDFSTLRKVVTSYPASLAPEVNGHFLSEAEVLSLPGADNIDQVSSAETSVLSIVGGKTEFALGSEVRVRVDLRDRQGRQKTHGGDGVRVWLRNRDLRASAAGYVIDLRNGSYEGVLRAVWSGKAEVVAAIATPLEQIQLMYRLYHVRGTMREILGKFRTANNQFYTTFCFPELPDNAGLTPDTEVCNLTSWNFGENWLCYRPRGANCSDYEGINKGSRSRYGPLSKTQFETNLLPLFHKNLRQTVTISVMSDLGEPVVRTTTPCHQRPWAATFLDSTPVGFFFRGTWHLRHCDVTARTPLQAYSPCLQNKTLYLFGDSTMRFLMDHLEKKLQLVVGDMKPIRPTVFQPSIRVRPEWKFTLYYTAHGMPFYGVHGESVAYHLDGIASNASGIVFMALYQHFSGFHPRAFQGRVRTTAQAVGRLVQRAPHVQVVVRGSHAYYHAIWDHAIAHDDYWGKLYDRIWKEELFPWRDHVVFLDTWDMTVGGENSNCHPPGPFLDALMQSLLAYTCHS